MYVADDLKRINLKEYNRQMGIKECDYNCQNESKHSIPVYNPADKNRGLDDAYAVIEICNECYENGLLYEDTFHCESCGELFIMNHSWNSLVCNIDGCMLCHSCALDEIEPIELNELIAHLNDNKMDDFIRISNYPNKERLGTFEFSEWSDFRGYTSLSNLAIGITEAAEQKGYNDLSVKVYPFIDHTYQFSISITIYID